MNLKQQTAKVQADTQRIRQLGEEMEQDLQAIHAQSKPEKTYWMNVYRLDDGCLIGSKLFPTEDRARIAQVAAVVCGNCPDPVCIVSFQVPEVIDVK